MAKMIPEFVSSPAIKRYKGGEPVLSKEHISFESDCVFNAGVTKYQGKYIMAFRNDYDYQGGDKFGQHVVQIAFSDDGIKWDVLPRPFLTMEMMDDPDITQIYDARLIEIEGRCYVSFAVNTGHGVRGIIAVTDDFEHIKILHRTVPDNRNIVLFPERIGGSYIRLERPFPLYSRHAELFDIWLSRSPDLRYWGDSRLLLGVEEVPFSNNKLGPAAPPLRTEQGWLTLFHGVFKSDVQEKFGWGDHWDKCYCAGIMLLDLEDPSKVIGLSREPLIAPETVWETELGYRTNVIFPGGCILEDDGSVKIYYGASDTFVCLATASVEDLLSLCAWPK